MIRSLLDGVPDSAIPDLEDYIVDLLPAIKDLEVPKEIVEAARKITLLYMPTPTEKLQ